jgi:stage III sporulation protein AB
MLRLLGAVLVTSGSAWIGFRAAAGLGIRVKALEEMRTGLALMDQELELDAPSLPALMERLIPRSKGPAKTLFTGCRLALARLEQEEFSAAWQRLIQQLEELGEEGRRALLPLGDILGRCGCEEQRQGLRAVCSRLEQLESRAEEERRQRGKVFRALGLSGGIFLVILLL